MISEALDFFLNRFNHDIVDFFVQETADALHVNMYIYQKGLAYIELLKVSASEGSKEIFMKYIVPLLKL